MDMNVSHTCMCAGAARFMQSLLFVGGAACLSFGGLREGAARGLWQGHSYRKFRILPQGTLSDCSINLQ